MLCIKCRSSDLHRLSPSECFCLPQMTQITLIIFFSFFLMRSLATQEIALQIYTDFFTRFARDFIPT